MQSPSVEQQGMYSSFRIIYTSIKRTPEKQKRHKSAGIGGKHVILEDNNEEPISALFNVVAKDLTEPEIELEVCI